MKFSNLGIKLIIFDDGNYGTLMNQNKCGAICHATKADLMGLSTESGYVLHFTRYLLILWSKEVRARALSRNLFAETRVPS